MVINRHTYDSSSPSFPKELIMHRMMTKQKIPQCRRTLPLLLHLMFIMMMALTPMLRPAPVAAQAIPAAYPLEKCQEGAFSTEEDFVMQEGEQYDGSPYISDGDLLSFNGVVCARNHDLLAAFAVGRYMPDLGLDALDILDITDRIIAFSTELDDPESRFESGDLALYHRRCDSQSGTRPALWY